MDIDGFLNHYKSFSERTREAYRNTLELLKQRISGEEPTDEEVVFFLDSYRSASTLQRHKSAIKAYYDFQKRLWAFDPRQFRRTRRRLPEYITREEVEKVAGAACDDHERMFVKTLFYTGMRIAELTSLTRESLRDGSLHFVGKGGNERAVPIVDKAFYGELRDYFHISGKVREKPFPLKYYDYWILLRKLCAKAGVKTISPHKLRHSRAVDLIQRGASVSVVQALLGHMNPATTLIYTQLGQQDLRKELEALE